MTPGSPPSRRLLVAALVALVALGAVPGTVAAETTVRPTVVVGPGETVSEDLTAAGGTVLVRGTVDGDLTALAADVLVTGEVTGDVTAVGGRVEITGRVGGDVRAFGGATIVSGDLERDLDTIGGLLAVEGRVGGAVDAIGVLVTVEQGGTVEGRLETSAVSTTVNGSVLGGGGAAVNQTQSLDADAAAPLAETPPRRASLPPAAAVAAGPMQLRPRNPFRLSVLDSYGFLVNLLLGVVLVALLPRFSSRVASLVARAPLRAGAFGLATSLLAPLVLLLFGLSLFGIPLAIAGAALLVVLWWVGAVYGRFAVGMWLLAAVPRALSALDGDWEPAENRWAGLLVGVFGVALLARIPYLGPVVDAVVALLGVGALVQLTTRAYRRSERSEPVATSPSIAGEE